MKILLVRSHFKNSLVALSIIAGIYGCGSKVKETESISNEDSTSSSKDIKISKTQSVFYSIPSPIETAVLLKKSGASFNKDYLNPVNNVSRYTSVESRALNLGVYGTDLSFANIFDQTQEAMLYVKSANNLANSLGISSAFGQQTLTRMEANMNNNDSLLSIISDAFWTTDTYLKENGRPNVSALILAGGWVEGLYVASQIAKVTNNQAIINRIGDQKLSLGNMIGLIESFQADEKIGFILKDLKDMKLVYDGMEVTKSKTEVATNKKTGITTIGNKSKVSMSKEQLNAICAKIETLRNKIIQ